MTKTLYAATSKYVEEINNLPVKRQVSVSGILKKLDVSRSGYNAWKKRVPSDMSIRRTVLKEKIQKIYEDSHQNYGAPKITAELRKSGEHVAEKTVGNYMRQMGIKAQWVKPYIQTTIDSDLSQKLKNILNEQFNPEHPDAVWCSDITYIWTFALQVLPRYMRERHRHNLLKKQSETGGYFFRLSDCIYFVSKYKTPHILCL